MGSGPDIISSVFGDNKNDVSICKVTKLAFAFEVVVKISSTIICMAYI